MQVLVVTITNKAMSDLGLALLSHSLNSAAKPSIKMVSCVGIKFRVSVSTLFDGLFRNYLINQYRNPQKCPHPIGISDTISVAIWPLGTAVLNKENMYGI